MNVSTKFTTEELTEFGTLFDAELDGYKFAFTPVLPDNRMIELLVGEILAISSKISPDVFLSRITKIRHGQESEYTLSVARQINKSKGTTRGPESAGIPSSDVYRANNRNQLFFVAECEPLGIIKADGSFVPPKTVPFYYSSVSKVNEENFPSELRNKLGDIYLGKLRSGSTVLDINAGLYSELLSYHVGVFAVTGKGKSNAIRMVCASILESMGRHSTVIFEPHGDYIKHLRKHPLANEYLKIYRNKNDNDPSTNRIRIAYSDITVDMLMMVKDYLGWTDAQTRVLDEAHYTYDNWFEMFLHYPMNDVELEEMEEREEYGVSTPDDDFYKNLTSGHEVPDRRKKMPSTLCGCFKDFGEDTLKAIRSKLRRIQKAPYIVRDDDASNLQSILTHVQNGKSILVDMGSLTGLRELFLSTVVSSSILNHNIKEFEKDEEVFHEQAPTVNIVMEEAQRVLGEDVPKNSIFASIVNEGRKYKVGFIAITQQPKNMSGKIMSQFNTLIILGITDENDFSILKGKSAKEISNLRHEIKSLAPGEAIISTAHSPFAVPVKIDLYENYLEKISDRYQKKESVSAKNLKKFFNPET